MGFQKFNKAEKYEPVSGSETSKISRFLQRLGKKSAAELSEEERERLNKEQETE